MSPRPMAARPTRPWCSRPALTSLLWNTRAELAWPPSGVLNVTAADGGKANSALVFQSKDVNAGLGVASGYDKGKHGFKITDGNYSLDSYSETLTLSFGTEVSLYALYFFPDDRST